jgi:LmbE family N-acetylglucosaminyl deacetylase
VKQLHPIVARPLLVLSPHLDDGVFCCGQLVASHVDAVVATVFAGRPPVRRELTEWDRAAGFQPGDDVIGRRQTEDRAALAILGATPVWLNFCDSQYQASPSRAQVAREVAALLDRSSPGTVLFPLGIFHSDHRLVHDAAMVVAKRRARLHWIAYEDVMYRRIPGVLDDRLRALDRAGLDPAPVAVPYAPRAAARKRRAVACYQSQLTALATPGRPGHADLAAPEGYWRVML